MSDFLRGALTGAGSAWFGFILAVVPSIYRMSEDLKYYRYQCDILLEKLDGSKNEPWQGGEH